MADVRESLARLNPSTIRMDIGRGGVPDLTNQDVAAALAFVPAGLGREVLIACWWPAGADSRKLMSAVLAEVDVEWRRQSKLLFDARTDVGIAEAIAGWNRSSTADERSDVDRARARYEAIRDACWPRDTGTMLPALVTACLEEIAGRQRCPDCEGRGEKLRGELRVPCARCNHTGEVQASNAARARAIGRDEASFRRNWAGVYMWILDLLRESEQEAARALREALMGDRQART